MGKNIVTKDTFISKVTEITKDYLDKGWTFNLEYMSCSNGTCFTAVTDGTETHLIYFKETYESLVELMVLRVEKFNTTGTNIFAGEGEVIHEEVFVQKYSKVNPWERKYYKVNSRKELEGSIEKGHKRRTNQNNFESKDISDKMKEALTNFIKSKGIPGLKRFKVSDVKYGHYKPRMKKYVIRIKDNIVEVYRDGWRIAVY